MRILVAEYTANARLALTRLLRDWGHETVVAKDTAEAWQALRADDAPRLGVGMLDTDHVKRVNDTFGDAAGDDVLWEVVPRTLTALRPCDVLGRFGGEESLILAPGADRTVLGAVLEGGRGTRAAAD